MQKETEYTRTRTHNAHTQTRKYREIDEISRTEPGNRRALGMVFFFFFFFFTFYSVSEKTKRSWAEERMAISEKAPRRKNISR